MAWVLFDLYLSHSPIDDDNEDSDEQTVRYTVYLNQLLSDSNKQDSLNVFSLFDAAMSQIYEELSFITDLILQTDNAKSYSNNFLLCAISLLNVIHKCNSPVIIKFIHAESGMEKTSWIHSLLDT